MATITGVTIFQHGTEIARAPSGEIAPPPDHQLTITGATWTGPRRNLDYLQQKVDIEATAAGQRWKSTLRITGIKGHTTIHLDP